MRRDGAVEMGSHLKKKYPFSMEKRILLTTLLLTGAALLPAQASLVAYYTLDGNFLDTSGNNNHGTLVGGAAYDGGSVPASIGSGMSVAFNGAAGTYGNIQNAAATGGLGLTGAPSFTVAMWVNGDAGAGSGRSDDRIFSEGQTFNNNPLFNVGTHNTGADGTVDIFIRNGGAATTLNHAHSPGTAFDGTWHHVLFSGGSDGMLDLYIDGIFDGTFDYSNVPAFPTDTTTIGGILRATDCCNFLGNIDDVSLWDQDLDAAAISALAGGASALQVPEPSAAILGLAGLMLVLRRRR